MVRQLLEVLYGQRFLAIVAMGGTSCWVSLFVVIAVPVLEQFFDVVLDILLEETNSVELLALLFQVVLLLVVALLEPDELLSLEVHLVAVAETHVQVLVLDALASALDYFSFNENVNISQLLILHLSQLPKTIFV